MKRLLVVLAAMMMVIAMVSGAFAAQSTQQNVTVTATVKEKCGTFVGGPLDLQIDPSTTNPTYSTGTDVTVQCAKSTAYTVTAATGGGSATGTSPLSGTLKAVSPGTNSAIPYSLYFTTGFTGAGFGGATPTTLITAAGGAAAGASVTAVAAQAAEVGTYSDTVVVTISY